MASPGESTSEERYSTVSLVRRLTGLAWQFRTNCLLSLGLSISLVLLGLAGLQLLGIVIDVIRHELDPALPAPQFPLGWQPPADWLPLRLIGVLAAAIAVQALLRATLTYTYNMVSPRLTQGEIVPLLRSRLYARLQHLSFSFFDEHGSHSIFN